MSWYRLPLTGNRCSTKVAQHDQDLWSPPSCTTSPSLAAALAATPPPSTLTISGSRSHLLKRIGSEAPVFCEAAYPAKALIESGEVFATVKSAADFGVTTSDPHFEWPVAIERKGKIVEGLVNGLAGMLKTRGVETIIGFGSLVGDGKVAVAHTDGSSTEIEARAIIIATGSSPATIPGYDINGATIVTSDEALDWESRPESVAIIGAGAIGCEFASFLADVGTEVHIFEVQDQLVPGMEPEAAKVLSRAFRRKGIKMHLGAGVGQPEVASDSVIIPFEDETVTVQAALVAVGRRPMTESINLDAIGVAADRGYIAVDRSTMLTTAPGVYAVGDIVAGTPQLAHVAFAEAIAAVTHIATGETAAVNYDAIPMVVYTHPENRMGGTHRGCRRC